MRVTNRLLYKGFWGRSVDEFKRYSNIIINLEGIKGPSGPLELHSFQNRESIENCKVMSDQDIDGFSTAQLDWVPHPNQSHHQTPAASPSTSPSPLPANPRGYARFHGTISTKLPTGRPEIQRSGYAGFRTRDRPPTIFGKSLWDIDPYTYLALRVLSDGRSYFVNVQTESVVPTDLHQHRLFTKRHTITPGRGGRARPGEWETILIKWNDFVRTNHGFVVEPQTEILRQKVKSVGFALTDRVEGPFELRVERIWATNDPELDTTNDPVVGPEETLRRESGLKNKHGDPISWPSQ